MSIRIRNTRTGRTTEARDGKDAALMVKIESDRRSGLEAIRSERLRGALKHKFAKYTRHPQ